jgi:uncharacterized protein
MPTGTTTVRSRELDERECWERLQRHEVGRIAVVTRGAPVIYPVGYAVVPGGISIRTRPGSKLSSILLDGRVSFEVDDRDGDDAWSVVVSGWAEEVSPERVGYETVPPMSPFAGPESRAVIRITPAGITGRSLHLG